MKYRLQIRDPKKVFQIEVDSSEDLLTQFLKRGLKVNHSCGGSGTCGTCQFVCQEGLDLLEKPNQIEVEFWQERGEVTQNRRLSCQSFLKNSNHLFTVESGLELKIKFAYDLKDY